MLLLVYRSLIRSVIEYGPIAYDSMGDDNKRKSDSIQSQALRIVCGVPRGTATAALQVDVGEPPLQIRRLHQQIQYATKVKCDDQHPASAVFKFHWTDRSKRYTSNTAPIRNKVAEFFSQNSMIKWEGPILPSRPPWHRKEVKVDVSVTKGGRKNENPTDLNIYTDASKTTEGLTAAAFFVPGFNVKYAVRLSNDISIFSAELIAIKMSLDWVLEFSQQFNLVKNIAIFIDSLSSSTAINTGKSLCRSNTLNEIYNVVDSINVDLKLIWIPSHLGIVGYEIVDQLAQSAVTSDKIDVDIIFEINEIYTKIKEFIIAKWQTSW